MGLDFTAEQKRWLEGFSTGLTAFAPLPDRAAAPEPVGPDAAGFRAQDASVAAGGKLVDPEKWKRSDPPLDAYDRLRAEALTGKNPKPDDNFRWRFHGLFWVAPAQDGYMCRFKIPNGILTHWQFAAVADHAERYGGGYSHATTRANLQVREIQPENAAAFLEGLAEVGIVAKGSGADNIRNVTGTATAGIDPQELLDTRPDARAWHHHLLNTRAMFGLPRKFNVAFDGGGLIPTLEDTNDIGFQAVSVGPDPQGDQIAPGSPVEPGIWYRLALGGITGHRDFARDTGIVLRPGETTAVADAIVRVFVEHGIRTDRTRARLKYVLDEWGFARFIAAVEERLGRALLRVEAHRVAPRLGYDRLAHVGVHAQRQPGLNWVGVALPVGRMEARQMHAIAAISASCGDGDIRLTVWQNLLVSGVPDEKVAEVKARLAAAGLTHEASSIHSGLVACTGSRGCKFAAADTKGHALEIARHVDATLTLDQPVNIHVTGCHNSCAQHYIGDIGLIGAKVPVGEDGDNVEGYDIHVGGGFGHDQGIGRLVIAGVKAEDAPARVADLLRGYLAGRTDEGESFHAFAGRQDIEALQRLVERPA